MIEKQMRIAGEYFSMVDNLKQTDLRGEDELIAAVVLDISARFLIQLHGATHFKTRINEIITDKVNEMILKNREMKNGHDLQRYNN